MGFQDSSWNVYVSSLVILSALVFEISSRRTDKQTDASENFPPSLPLHISTHTHEHFYPAVRS